MTTTVQMDKAGRLVLPKRVRERFHLHPGDTLALEVTGDSIELRPHSPGMALKCINGVLVVVSQQPVPPGRDLVSESREQRLAELTQELPGRK